MTRAERNTAWPLSGDTDTDTRPLTRRRFLSTLLPSLASACAAPSALDYLCSEKGLLAEAAELSRKAVTVDLHCHPNNVGGRHFPELDPDVPGNMKAGGLDAGRFAARGNYPIIRRDSSGRRYESRQIR
jgi:hypothetical protein